MTPSKVPAAQSTLRILSHLATQRGPVPASQIATALGLPRSSVYDLLAVLADQGFVVHLPEEQRYGLGLAAFELSSGFSRQQPLSHLGRPLVAALVDRLGESAHLVVLHGRDVIYLVEERAPRRPSLVTDVGVRLPSHLTASGRALLAALPAAQLRALYPNAAAFATRHGRGPRTTAELRTLLEQVRRDGYALEDGEITEGMASVAVAVRDHAGWPAAGIAVTFPRERIAEVDWPALAAQLGGTAAQLSRRIRGT
ncbi:IclR family transcriptional regulator [Cryobacterium sp. TMT1-62]|uniref:IclR family transcriptional regulator n=1 Tax=Cryobacterium sandaracinum TaxID=1259247 RepID=A0ABY2JGV5_9MICO|nr:MULTISPECIES: IclR family transcriptional regulator [Cryobacterium]TFB55130.1 IclR family transcriptional regulator [Cryobacterium sp. Sr3]TFC36333.1 IclR family transcriptional regulator [Cryobacterium sp. TMT2-14]TFC65199.1 IclR family transcriptional regulator [Cryobacterium sp. TMT2-4]TFD02936.1 IclR family transcriptional regulator [Cryobacterium sandaracinum]TFD29905.1 IclR family transcriptional regulator [Cryobacterium sp. TMT1-62]